MPLKNNQFDFLTADWHLGESRFEIMQRPFKTVKEHNDTLIANHNSLVQPGDRVLVIGDAVNKTAQEFLSLVANFNGRKTLIRGNHDIAPDDVLLEYFEEVVPEGESVEVEVAGKLYNAVHYPTLAKPDQFNLVGHIHGAWKYQLNTLNVGIDANHFYPHPAKAVEFYIEAVTKFYDDDVWAAYLDANASWRDRRG